MGILRFVFKKSTSEFEFLQSNCIFVSHKKIYSMDIHDDRLLLQQIKEGNKRAFETIYLKYSAKLYNFVASILHDKTIAEDITQTCFLKIWEKRTNIDIEKSFSSYLFTIARNDVYKETERLVQASRYFEKVQAKSDELDEATIDKINALFLESHIDELIEKLPPARKEIFILNRKHHLTNKEIAEKLSISEKTVEVQMYRALRFLKEQLKHYLLSFLL